jgi:predicted RNase H-like HicB family nuclease
MEYVFPAIFAQNDDGSYTVTFPDLPGCISEGKSLGNALYMAESALTQWIEYLTDKKQEIPAPSSASALDTGAVGFVNLVRAKPKDGRAVKRTVSIPAWMDKQAAASGLSLSRILQEALTQKLDMG